jgi:hypothetical protein
VRPAVGRPAEHLNGLGPPEALASGVDHLCSDELAGDRVGDEHDAALVVRDRDAAVRDALDLELEDGPGFRRPRRRGATAARGGAARGPAPT